MGFWSALYVGSTDLATSAVDAAYERLETTLGEERWQALQDEDDDVATLGELPELDVSKSSPSPDEERESLAKTKKKGVVEEKAIDRLATCKSTIRIQAPPALEDSPVLVSMLRWILEQVGPCVYAKTPGSTLVTSESLLKELKALRDVDAAVRELDEADDDEDEDDEDDEEEEGDDDEDDEDAPIPNDPSVTADALRSMLAAIAENPRARRKAGDLFERAPELVVKLAQSLGRDGAAADDVLARRLGVTPAKVASARNALATLIDRAND